MAKSIRSRWKRKCRAIKRERYAVKELARLKKTLGIVDDEKKDTPVTQEEVMESDQVIFFDACAIKKEQEQKKKKGKKSKKVAEAEAEGEEDVEMSSDDEKIEVDGDKGEKRVFSLKTLKDQNGQYPVWLHKRKIAKLNKSTNKRNTKKRSKKRKRL